MAFVQVQANNKICLLFNSNNNKWDSNIDLNSNIDFNIHSNVEEEVRRRRNIFEIIFDRTINVLHDYLLIFN